MNEETKTLTMSVKEAAAYMGVGPQVVYNLVHIEGFPVIRFGKRCRIVRADLDGWVRDNAGRVFEISGRS